MFISAMASIASPTVLPGFNILLRIINMMG
nr:MAG TPA: hypothetical protein [Caudoviricetes sp.]